MVDDPSRFKNGAGAGLLLLALALPFNVSCAAHTPPSLTTVAAQDAYVADQVVTRLGEFQTAVIDAAQAGKVKLEDARTIVTWISGDKHASPPAIGAIDIIRTIPNGWQAVVRKSWEGIRPQVLADQQIAPWVPTIDSLIAGGL